MPIQWERPLTQRRSAQQRLAGIDVFHDFDWREVFGHNKGAFRNGQSLSGMVRRECPDGKRPTLILTTLPSAQPNTFETADRYGAIVPIHQYLTLSGVDAAATYFARASGARVTRLSTLREVTFSPQELHQFLASNLTDSVLREWMAMDPTRRQILRDLAGTASTSSAQASEVGAVQKTVFQVDDATLRDLVSTLRLQPVEGRAGATLALAAKLPQRIADVRAELAEYSGLVEAPGTSETDVQTFLEHHPWIVGLHYVRARGRVEVPRGAVDFVLERFDGFFDIVELKGPADAIVVERSGSMPDDRPGSPSRFTLGPALATALAQAHLYRSILRDTNSLRGQFGLLDTRQPRILIFIGLSRRLTEGARDVLRELNLSLHRVEVIPYDLLGVRMSGLISNLETLMARPSDEIANPNAAD